MKKYPALFMIVFFLVFAASQIYAEMDNKDVYKIGINDVLEIRVLDHDELRTMATVASDGTITFPYIGTIMVKGMKISEIEKEITRQLSTGYIKYPVVIVSLLKSLSRKIYTYGEINKRGEVPYEDNMTIMQALSIVGGISSEGLHGKLVLRRKLSEKRIEYKELFVEDINNGLLGSPKIEDTPLMPDDILIVQRNNTFLIEGEVSQRGRFVLEKDITVLRALLQAGGVNENGKYGRIVIRRKQPGLSGGYKDIIDTNLIDGVFEKKEVEDTLLMPDDIVLVEKSKTFLIQGEVAQRGRFTLEKYMTVLKALLQAGGVTKDAAFGSVKLRRRHSGKTGDYRDLVESDMNEGVIESNEVADTLLQPDDIIMVERNKTFFMFGEVQRTGEFTLTNDLTVFQAITIAGGFTKWGSGSRVKILRPQKAPDGFESIKVNIKDVLDGDASADVYLKAKDTIVVSTGIF